MRSADNVIPFFIVFRAASSKIQNESSSTWSMRSCRRMTWALGIPHHLLCQIPDALACPTFCKHGEAPVSQTQSSQSRPRIGVLLAAADKVAGHTCRHLQQDFHNTSSRYDWDACTGRCQALCFGLAACFSHRCAILRMWIFLGSAKKMAYANLLEALSKHPVTSKAKWKSWRRSSKSQGTAVHLFVLLQPLFFTCCRTCDQTTNQNCEMLAWPVLPHAQTGFRKAQANGRLQYLHLVT